MSFSCVNRSCTGASCSSPAPPPYRRCRAEPLRAAARRSPATHDGTANPTSPSSRHCRITSLAAYPSNSDPSSLSFSSDFDEDGPRAFMEPPSRFEALPKEPRPTVRVRLSVHYRVHRRQMLCIGGSQIPFGWAFISITKVRQSAELGVCSCGMP